MMPRRQVILKYLRTAVTAVCLTACVLLVALWVRSYWRCDSYNRQQSGHISRFRVISMKGYIYVLRSHLTVGSTGGFRSYPISNVYFERNEFMSSGEAFTMRYRFVSTYGVPVFLVACLSMAPWIPWRFSVRTMLIATALVALGLGIIVALT